ncbi:ABC transporter permease [Cellulomonas sp. NPDC089187]|uniref:ABC transporter permease n=1 Tax=Cellulomonas sp. NPDC089187 TaxID=3154970 RepID=UPI00343B7404
MMTSNWLVTLAALLLALIVSGVLIAAADDDVHTTAGYLFARPGDFLSAVWDSVWSAYVALFQGAIVDPTASSFTRAIRPLTETMTWSVPLVLAGLGLAVGFRAGLFNIGAQGQIILGAIFGGYIGFAFGLPPVLHLLLAIIAAALGGAIWAGIAGFLKARTGANEVIVTIMLNNIAIQLVAYLLSTTAFKREGSNNPQSPPIESTATYPLLLGNDFRLHAGFLLAVLATVFVWWLMDRSTLGFQFRAVGANPSAARTAGININKIYLLVMVVSGALAGLAGSAQVLGTEKVLTAGVAASFGFDAITVALLGRSKPLGTFLAGLLFGALRAGGFAMQSRTGTPIDIVLVVQSLVVLFIAAPPLVRTVFRLPTPGRRKQISPTPAPVTKEAAA